MVIERVFLITRDLLIQRLGLSAGTLATVVPLALSTENRMKRAYAENVSRVHSDNQQRLTQQVKDYSCLIKSKSEVESKVKARWRAPEESQ
jgi:hypothetical protein